MMAVGAGAAHPAESVMSASDLQLEYVTAQGQVRALDSATLQIKQGELVALVGESGSGKSTLGMAAGRLLASNAQKIAGSLFVGGVNVFEADGDSIRKLRREVLGFIFQNPVAALDPTMRIQKQIELVMRHVPNSPAPRDALEQVGLRDVPRVLRSFPHELSGGMAQRVGIAMALLRRPQLMIADEPTAAVDATLRPKILELLAERSRAQGCALLLLTHDLHAVQAHATHVAVMYGGRVVEYGQTQDVLSNPAHPYTQALVTALPGEEIAGERLEAIGGTPPVLSGASLGCAFSSRCPAVMSACTTVRPNLARLETSRDRSVCCHLVAGPIANGSPAGATPQNSSVASSDHETARSN